MFAGTRIARFAKRTVWGATLVGLQQLLRGVPVGHGRGAGEVVAAYGFKESTGSC